MLSREEVTKRLKDVHGDKVRLVGDYLGMLSLNRFECPEGHTWLAKPVNVIVNKSKCPTCFSANRKGEMKTDEQYAKELKIYGLTALEPYKGATVPIKHRCQQGHVFTNKPNYVLSSEYGCKECFYDKRNIPNRLTSKELLTRTNEVHGDKYTWLTEDLENSRKAPCRCNKCGHEWEVLPSTLNSKKKGAGCPKCFLLEHDFSRLNKKPYLLAGEQVYIQGYENHVLDMLQDEYNIDPEYIFVGNEVPSITYLLGGKEHIHRPDVWLPLSNTLIEVKSTWTFGVKRKQWFYKNRAKTITARDLGYNYFMLVIDRDGTRLPLPKGWETMEHKTLMKTLNWSK